MYFTYFVIHLSFHFFWLHTYTSSHKMYVLQNEIYRRGPMVYLCYFNLIVYQVHGMISLMACLGAFSGVALISIYRCVVIVGDGKIVIRRHHVITMIVFGWSIVLSMMVLAGAVAPIEYLNSTHHCSPSWHRSCAYYGISLALGYGVTFPVMMVSYGLIVLKVKRSSERVQNFSATEKEVNAVGKESSDLALRAIQEEGKASSGAAYSHFEGETSDVIVTGENHRFDAKDDQEGQRTFDDLKAGKEEAQNYPRGYKVERKRNRYHRQQKQVAFTGNLLCNCGLMINKSFFPFISFFS